MPKLDIVELVRRSTTLTPVGDMFKGNCPFHNERVPSFYVYPENQTWRCFGSCATGGDAFTFVMKRDECSFHEAMNTLRHEALDEPVT